VSIARYGIASDKWTFPGRRLSKRRHLTSPPEHAARAAASRPAKLSPQSCQLPTDGVGPGLAHGRRRGPRPSAVSRFTRSRSQTGRPPPRAFAPQAHPRTQGRLLAAFPTCTIIRLECARGSAFKNGMYECQDDPRRDPHPRCSECGEVMEMVATVPQEHRPDAVTLTYRCPSGHMQEMLARRVQAAA
jgi:hypothetical protein